METKNPCSTEGGLHPPDTMKIPRLYQAELLEEAKKRNIIIRADTGTGKTFVALSLITWIAAQSPANQDDHRIQAFLAPTRPLAHQQAEYIQKHCTLRVKAYTGDLQPELWNIDKWHSELNEVDVIVSTAQIFYDLISKGYWKLEDVSLLIFDEAHHCRKNHIYNQIMRSHYHRLAKDPTLRLPKILGLTASPIWNYKDLERADSDIKSLQSALAAQIYEVKTHTEDVCQHNFKPNEKVVYFEPSPEFEKNSHPPWDQINQLLSLHASPKMIAAMESVSLELGTYAHSLAVLDWLKSLLTVGASNQVMSGRLLDPNKQKQIREIIEELEELVNIDDIPETQFSSKVAVLNKILVSYKEKDNHDNFLCIVFVERRQHAQLLPFLLERNGQLKGFLRPTALTGHAGGNVNDLIGIKMDSRTQNKAVAKFRTGEYNLTIATSVAEEGLDFRSCRVVIRFDLITTWKGYIQSRGRARARESDYIVMLPNGTTNKYLEFTGKEEQLKAALYNRPEDELIEEGEEEWTPQLICQLAGGKESILTYSAATSLLNDVCQLIPPDEFLPVVAPQYEITWLGDNFQCQVTLPPMAALHPSQRTFTGLAMATKKDAKRSAAFEACKVLRELDVLNQHFLPQREGKSAQICDADGREIEATPLSDQVEAIIPNVYGDFRTSTEIWLHKFSFPDDSPDGFSTMGLLCARHLTVPDGLQLFDHYTDSRPLPITIEQSKRIQWGQDDAPTNLQRLETFSRVVMQAAINRKAYEGKLYFLVAPLLRDTCEIDWNLVDTPMIPLSDTADSLRYQNTIAPIRHLHYRIFDTCEPAGDISEASPPQSVPACPSMRDFCKKISKFHNLGHFYKVVYDLKEEQFQGELVYLETTFHVLNNLSKSESTVVQPHRILLPLKLCKGTQIPRSMWKVFSYLPSLTRLLHDSLQATALFKRLDFPTISLLHGIQALTPPGGGVPWDYQTLETLGDAFLKLATSVHVYLSHLKKGEGDMSHVRSRSVDNAYLRRKAIQANLPASILSQRFRTDRFRDPQTEDGKELPNGNFSRKIPKRVLSDVVEALLGAGFLTGGIELGLKIGTALDLCFGGTTPWSERPVNIGLESITHDALEPSTLLKCQALEEKIGYVFKEKLLLVQALTHRSANSFMTNCYEREEWLGDAVIDMWIVEHAYKRFDHATAEELTLARAKVVSNGSLGFLAIKKLGLQEIIMHASENFEQACTEAIEAIKHFAKIGEFFSTIDNLFVVFDPPKILNDVLEAIVGAVFIDSGFNLQSAYRTLDIIFEDVIPGLSRLVARDPLSTMLRLRDQYQCAELRRISTTIREPNPNGEGKDPISVKVCRIELHGQEIASGRHKNSASVAEQRASLEALKVLQEPPSESPTSHSVWSTCQCKTLAVAATTLASSNLAKSKKNKKRKAVTTLDKVSPAKVPKKEDSPTTAQPEESTKMDSVIASKAENMSLQRA
ncbi:Dicer-like protein 1 [Puccinia graminis f. sp. tritici]|uniref:Dicer-like protein 1 n=1 Tax=Puccinia graminis f. sp. tritici TaxID=56615 RepID=A0A5B0MGI3_PUCGR|nr:Dicer-like protein 1 [Puccinia graminis f. sp. tritici]KAA1091406.1 Dicer-like protein 1 [Puccinia graminis f. sp. tritici]